ncbi:MAG: hydrogen gas-evolving membrane-bound hydrogenase subunit E [Spirochaetota bacterium]
MRLFSVVAIVILFGFLFVGILHLHPVGEALGNSEVLQGRPEQGIDINGVSTMDDYFLRNGQIETKSNNIVASVVFDYRGFDTLGEATVLFIVVSSISMLFFTFLKSKSIVSAGVPPAGQFPKIESRVISFGSFIMYIMILSFGVYLVVHGHISPGGGFQGGSVMASATALLLISFLITRHMQRTRKIFSFFESMGLTIFIGLGFAGITISFLYNFLAHTSSGFGRIIAFGPNQGYLISAGILPLLSLAVGIEVFFGLSLIVVTLFHASGVKDTNSLR